jgi:nifR3 family TIM-barrel protein
VGEGRVDHLDLNFGCPVRKVTRKGGGAAIPARPRLLAAIIRAAVAAAERVPITVKFRMGIDDDHLTHLESGRVAETEGCAAVTLHARTAAQLYDGKANWTAIAELKNAVTTIPVIGNGDVWVAEGALRLVRETGCDGVAVGRGCLGRPWLFRDLADAFEGRPLQPPPTLGEVADIMIEHATLLVDWFGESTAMPSFRKHGGWYTRGFRSSARLRDRLMRVTDLDELKAVLAGVERDEPFPAHGHLVKRGKRSGRQRVVLPPGWLDHPDDATPPGAGAEELISGG